MLEKTLESPLDSKQIKSVNPKGNQPWIFIGITGVEAPILWPGDKKSWLIGEAPDVEKDRKKKEKGAAEDDIVRWHHWLNGHEWENPGRQWRTNDPGMLQSVGLQRVENDLVTEQQPQNLIRKNSLTTLE